MVESSQSNCIEIDCNIRVACRPRGARAEKSACLRENRVPRFSARVVPCMRATRGSVAKARGGAQVLKDEPVIEMESVYGHYSLNQLACVHL